VKGLLRAARRAAAHPVLRDRAGARWLLLSAWAVTGSGGAGTAMMTLAGWRFAAGCALCAASAATAAAALALWWRDEL
jgi:hypothetical protein